MRKAPILTLDFDGVIHSYASPWVNARTIPDPPVPGALEFLVAALDHFQVNIFSSRSHQWGGRRAMRNYIYNELMKLGTDHDTMPGWWKAAVYRTAFADPWPEEVSWQAKCIADAIKYPFFKPPSHLMIDDRAVTFTGTFPKISEVANFKPWNKPEDGPLVVRGSTWSSDFDMDAFRKLRKGGGY